MRGVLLVTTIAVASIANDAYAGDCSNGGPDVVAELEAFARGKLKSAPEVNTLCIEQGVIGDAKLTKRFFAACEKIVAKDPRDATCIRWSIELGAKKLGTFDLFDAVTATMKIEPFVYGNTAGHLYVTLDDPRGVPLMREAWKAASADKRAKMDHRHHQHNITVFRHSAIKLMTKHGTKADATFLAEQQPAIKDRGLKRAIDKAIAAIGKRQPEATP